MRSDATSSYGVLFLGSERVRERVLRLVGKAYTTIKAPDLCALLGQSEEEVRQSELESV